MVGAARERRHHPSFIIYYQIMRFFKRTFKSRRRRVALDPPEYNINTYRRHLGGGAIGWRNAIGCKG